MRITTLGGFDVIRVEKQPKCRSLNISPSFSKWHLTSPRLLWWGHSWFCEHVGGWGQIALNLVGVLLKKKKAVLANPWGVSMTHFPQNLELFLRSPSGKFPCGLPKSLNICWGMGGFLSFRNELSAASSRLQDLCLLNPKRLTTPAQREPTITTHKYIPANIWSFLFPLLNKVTAQCNRRASWLSCNRNIPSLKSTTGCNRGNA